MGCTSSTQYHTDAATGKVVKKKTLGGAYPGQQGAQHAPYRPPESAFQQGQATAHFVAYGGGNAMVLKPSDGSHARPESGGLAKYVQVTLPKGVSAGQTIHVQAPDGRTNAIVIPEGYGPGSTFTVEFAKEPQIATTQTKANTPVPNAGSSYQGTTSPSPPAGDDGFASGFNNPHWKPASVNTTTRNSNMNGLPEAEAEIDMGASSSYSATATAQPYVPTYHK